MWCIGARTLRPARERGKRNTPPAPKMKRKAKGVRHSSVGARSRRASHSVAAAAKKRKTHAPCLRHRFSCPTGPLNACVSFAAPRRHSQSRCAGAERSQPAPRGRLTRDEPPGISREASLLRIHSSIAHTPRRAARPSTFTIQPPKPSNPEKFWWLAVKKTKQARRLHFFFFLGGGVSSGRERSFVAHLRSSAEAGEGAEACGDRHGRHDD